MEIIIPGNNNAHYFPKTFRCDRCGCVFKADADEYKLTTVIGLNKYERYACKCPACKNQAFEFKESEYWDQIVKILSQKAKEFETHIGQSIK